MTKAELLGFKIAWSPMYNKVVQIQNVRADENGQPIIDGMVDGKICYFRVAELTDFR